GAVPTPGGQGGGVYNGPSNTLNLVNTIVALDLIFANSQSGENNANGTYDDLAGTAASQNDHNLIGGANDAALAPGGLQQLFAVPVTSNNLGKYVLQGQAPGNFVGMTYTLPLAWNTSPAISTGNPSAASNIASAEGVSTGSATDARGL